MKLTEQQKEIALPERDATKPAEQQGLFRKFDVRRTDGSSEPGGKHENCEYFVLDTDHDPNATAALVAYANSVEATHPELAADMRNRYALPKPEPVAYADAFGNVITKATKEFSRNVLTNEFNRPLYATPPQSDDVRDAWQPIETAPKDEVVLAWIEYRDLSCARVGSFDLAGGFHIDGNARCTDCATHWMPLPEAPAIAAAKGEK